MRWDDPTTRSRQSAPSRLYRGQYRQGATLDRRRSCLAQGPYGRGDGAHGDAASVGCGTTGSWLGRLRRALLRQVVNRRHNGRDQRRPEDDGRDPPETGLGSDELDAGDHEGDTTDG